LRLARTARRQHLVHIVFASSTLLMVMNDDGANQIFSYFFFILSHLASLLLQHRSTIALVFHTLLGRARISKKERRKRRSP
jgi:hypothetical protein